MTKREKESEEMADLFDGLSSFLSFFPGLSLSSRCSVLSFSPLREEFSVLFFFE